MAGIDLSSLFTLHLYILWVKYFTKLKLFSIDIIALEGSVDNVNTEATNDHAFIWVSSTKCGQDQKGFSSAYLGFIVAKKIRNSAKEQYFKFPTFDNII